VSGLIRLGWSQLAVVSSGVATMLLVWWIVFMPTLQELYVREVALPRIADRYGFEFGTVRFSRDNVSYEWPGFVNVKHDGAVGRIGVRARDVLFHYHGYGATSLYSALLASERGDAAEFEVFNADDWSAGRDGASFRIIEVPPRK
jgi:hypothetical protein